MLTLAMLPVRTQVILLPLDPATHRVLASGAVICNLPLMKKTPLEISLTVESIVEETRIKHCSDIASATDGRVYSPARAPAGASAMISVHKPPLFLEYSILTVAIGPVACHLIFRVVSPTYQVSPPLGSLTTILPLITNGLAETSTTLASLTSDILTLKLEPIKLGIVQL